MREVDCKGCRKEKLNGGEDDMDNDMARQEQVADNGSNHVDNVAETLFEGEDTVEAINEMVETPEVQSLQVMNKCNLRGSMCCSLGQQFSPLVRDGINTGEGLGNIHVHANFTDILFGHNLRKSIPTPVPTTFSRPANVVGQENSNQLEETIECTSVAGSGKVVKPKARRKNKTIEEILNLTKPSSERKKQKCVVYRSAAAAMALSVSTDGIVNRNRILLNEAQAARALDNLFGNNFKGSEEEVVSKILQMEIQDAERAELQAKMPAN